MCLLLDGSESEKVRLRLTMAVEGVDFDPKGARGACAGNAPVAGCGAGTKSRVPTCCGAL